MAQDLVGNSSRGAGLGGCDSTAAPEAVSSMPPPSTCLCVRPLLTSSSAHDIRTTYARHTQASVVARAAATPLHVPHAPLPSHEVETKAKRELQPSTQPCCLVHAGACNSTSRCSMISMRLGVTTTGRSKDARLDPSDKNIPLLVCREHAGLVCRSRGGLVRANRTAPRLSAAAPPQTPARAPPGASQSWRPWRRWAISGTPPMR